MQRVKASVLWVLDVIVGVFIGPVERSDERGQMIRRIADRRSTYALAVAGCMLILVTVYVLVNRWPGGSM